MAVNMLHPTRVQIIEKMADGKLWSPNGLVQVLEAERLAAIEAGRPDHGRATLGTVAYHVRTMLDAGVIALADETRVRGAVEHHYRIVKSQREALREQMEATRALALRAKRALAA